MAIVDDLWLAALTRDENDAGSKNRFNLTVNLDGRDVLDQDFTLGLIYGGPSVGFIPGLGKGQAGLEESSEHPLSTPFDPSVLTNSSIRLGIRGEDAWGPQHVLLFGHIQPAFTPGQFIALAMETDLTLRLSTDPSDGGGSQLTTRLRLVLPGSATTVIRRVLLLVYTESGSDVETTNSIVLQIAAAGALVLHQKITDDLNKNLARWYFLEVEGPFTKGDIDVLSGINLSILGTDAWLPKRVFVFGLDTATGRPNEVVTLVSIPEWDLGWLSTDHTEGNSPIPLQLAI
jgi:hypothetical protein